ncbi:MAG: hypothetical protein GC203_17150 [Phenylobacterium sp.]|uniref:hypothetical protein n=1 Tax=Phenylobacterium sp. TaxID=1871053 RepID=UPI0025E91BBF|nr:hypothetical protein [Phenylobacterium sp.]MBI1199591.1 hypothetical protein [Phenylobacterium sp.]
MPATATAAATLPMPPLALVARPDDSYLRLTPAGAAEWVTDPASATAFDTLREATRMAMRLPAGLRAFGLPRVGSSE